MGGIIKEDSMIIEWERVKRLVCRDNSLNLRGIIDEEEFYRRVKSYRGLNIDWWDVVYYIVGMEGNELFDSNKWLFRCIWED